MESNETERTTAGLPRTVRNPVTGESVTFLVTGEETGGEYVRVRCDVPAGAQGPSLHYHTTYTESFEVVEGRLDVGIGDRKNHVVLTEGETAFAPIGVLHRFWNESGEPCAFVAEVRPARNFEKVFRASCGLAADGKVNGKGIPKNIFELALLFELGESYLPGLPLSLQRRISASLAKMARRRGYDPEFSRYTKPKGA